MLKMCNFSYYKYLLKLGLLHLDIFNVKVKNTRTEYYLHNCCIDNILTNQDGCSHRGSFRRLQKIKQ